MIILDIPSIEKKLNGKTPEDIVHWAWQVFGESAAVTSSFQSHSLPLLHIVSKVAPDLPILFLDTGFHFEETLEFRDRIVDMFDLNLKVLRVKQGHDSFKKDYGNLYNKNPDLCCHLNKVQPLVNLMKDYNAWIAGIRNNQTKYRSEAKLVSTPKENNPYNVYKICPILDWSSRDVWNYIADNELPQHPLTRKGYLSIGCAPCTRPVLDKKTERSGRWENHEKTECGLHTKQ
jgi:phosphoadenosine phosphosulfate reductase